MSFYDEIGKLKSLERRGWILRNVSGRVESDAEHTFSMMLLALDILAKNQLNLNENKVLKMIAYHELCEIDAGDTIPYDKVSKEEEFSKEYACIKRLSKEYGLPEIESLWLEYEENKTPEAQFVKKLDKYDAVMQARIYSKEQDRQDIEDDFTSYSAEIVKEFDRLEK